MVVHRYVTKRDGRWIIEELGLTERAHSESRCVGEFCVFHNPSKHHMLWWHPTIDPTTGVVWRRCPDHLKFHPDPDSSAWYTGTVRCGAAYSVAHWCPCRCCGKPDEHRRTPDEPARTPTSSIRLRRS